MSEIELFLQAEGIRPITVLRVEEELLAAVLAAEAKKIGFPGDPSAEFFIFIEGSDEPIDHQRNIHEHGLSHGKRVHIHRCKSIEVTLNYGSKQKKKHFPPSATVARVKRRAVKVFHIPEADASSLVLKICGQPDYPSPDDHIGALTTVPSCSLCFDLVPPDRNQG